MSPEPQGISAEEIRDSGGSFALVVDVRPRRSVVRGHLPGSAWLPCQLPERALPSHMLPPRGERVFVAHDDGLWAREVASDLRLRGWEANYLTAGWEEYATATGVPEGRLWRPDSFLERVTPRLPDPARGPVLDLGGGNGRNAIFLAQQGHDVLVVDRLQDALDLAQERAHHHGVDVRTLCRDLRDPGALPPGPYATVLLIRFLPRSLIEDLQEVVTSGGMVVVRSFVARDRPRSRRHELALEDVGRLFPPLAWNVVHGPMVATEVEGMRQRDLLETLIVRASPP